MEERKKLNKTEIMQKLANFLQVKFRTIQNHLFDDVNYYNLHTKKMFWEIQQGLPYYDMNKILREVSIEVAETNNICRFILCYNTIEGKTTQQLECVCNGKLYFTKISGIEGINSILEQIGFEKRLEEPKDYINLVVWK